MRGRTNNPKEQFLKNEKYINIMLPSTKQHIFKSFDTNNDITMYADIYDFEVEEKIPTKEANH